MVARWRTAQDLERRRPRHAVWELTLSCNLKCRHCGSRAGAPRSDELTTAEALSLVDALADAGVREVTLIGGEAYLRRDWLEIVRAIRSRDDAWQPEQQQRQSDPHAPSITRDTMLSR